MPRLTIDGKIVEVEEGTTILEAAKRLNIFIPHFCYHPTLSIAGNCRMCMVEVAGQSKPVISCREEVKDGMVVLTASAMVKELRQSVLEFILINHPIDCPVCDQSGECILQNYYFNYSCKASRMTEPKVKKPKAKRIGQRVILDAERCVECTRCVRFCSEITKTGELTINERSDHSEIGIFNKVSLDNPYSLCTVDLCPVGALTSIDFRFKKRVWFLTSTESVCSSCATGCNIFIDHCDGVVYRYRPRRNDDVNGFWMCDYGRLSYKRINSDERVLFPTVNIDGEGRRTSWEDALFKISELMNGIKGEDVVGVLSAVATVEENEAFEKFLKDAVKTPQIYAVGRKREASFADDLLRDADRNPNSGAVRNFANKRLEEASSAKVYFVLDGDEDLLAILKNKLDKTVLLASHYKKDWPLPAVLLPKATFAEQAGSFINRKGIRQKFERSISPVGEAASGVEISSRLCKHLILSLPL